MTVAWSISSIWLNQIDPIDQMNETDAPILA